MSLVMPIEIALLEPGSFDAFVDGVFHRKTAPCLIVAQACRGIYEVRRDGEEGVAREGEVFLALPGDLLEITHRGAVPGQAMQARWLHVSYHLHGALDAGELLELPLIVGGQAAREAGDIIGELLAIRDEFSLQGVARREALALDALAWLCKVGRVDEDRLGRLGRMQPVLRHIREHLAAPLEIGSLARVAGLSRSRFHAFFREQMGCSPMDYVKTLRMRQACFRLSGGDDSVGQIAGAVGFANAFHFSREFRRCMGTPPTAWREASRKRLA
jgi:AraC family transcriptional regulator of arabinose operon